MCFEFSCPLRGRDCCCDFQHPTQQQTTSRHASKHIEQCGEQATSRACRPSNANSAACTACNSCNQNLVQPIWRIHERASNMKQLWLQATAFEGRTRDGCKPLPLTLSCPGGPTAGFHGYRYPGLVCLLLTCTSAHLLRAQFAHKIAHKRRTSRAQVCAQVCAQVRAQVAHRHQTLH